MDTPVFVDGQFVNATLLSYAVAAATSNFKTVGSELHSTGLLNPSSLTFTPSNLTVQIDAPSPFAVLFGSGLVVGAHGTVAGADTSTYSLNLSSLVPGSGSQTVYILAEYATVSEDLTTVVGPPPGHPDYDPAFTPFEFYTVDRDTLSIVGSTSPADNSTSFELARISLSAGQGTITSAEIVTSHWYYASSVLNPTGVAPGSYTNANITVQADGRISAISAAVTFMVGEVKLWPVSTPPAGFLNCDGSAVSRTTYSNLYNLIGTTFGAGDGSTTFNLPDMRARVPVGWDSGAGTGRVTSGTSGVDSSTVGASGGDQRLQLHVHAITDPGHSHGVTDPGHNHGISDPGHNHGTNDPGHAHGIADPGHSHGVSDPGHLHAEGSSAPGNSFGGGSASTEILNFDTEGARVYNNVNTSTNGTGIGIDGSGTGVGVYGNTTGVSNQASGTGVSVNSNTTGVTTNSATTGVATVSTGNGVAQNMQPSLVLNYIIFAG